MQRPQPKSSRTSLSERQDLFRRVHQLKIRCESAIDQDFAGSYDSALKGSGIEFEETRPYLPGDDVRSMDWRVTARTGVPHIRRFREERQLTIQLMVDGSGSMHRGSRSPYEVAVELSAMLSLLAAAEGDRIGLTLFADGLQTTLPPAGGMSQTMQILRELIHARPTGKQTEVGTALRQVCRTQQRRGVIFLISDFLVNDLELPLVIAAKQHQIIPVMIADRTDGELPPAGLIPLRDRETGEVRWLDAFNRRHREMYDKSSKTARSRWDSLFNRLRLRPIKLDTECDVALELRRYFARED